MDFIAMTTLAGGQFIFEASTFRAATDYPASTTPLLPRRTSISCEVGGKEVTGCVTETAIEVTDKVNYYLSKEWLAIKAKEA